MKLASRTLYGVELVDSVARLCCMNMLLHGISGNGADEVPIDSGRDALSSHGRRHGVYALYRGNRLYYVGLASNLRSRLNTHLRHRHANTWDHFSVYLTVGDEHLAELESLVLRISSPKGNKVRGKFARSEDLRSRFRRQVSQYQKIELNRLFGLTTPREAEKIKTRIRGDGRIPTLARYVSKRFKIRFDYKGKVYMTRVRSDGTINYRGTVYTSPSTAATAVTKRATDGWWAWKYQRAPGDWVRLDEMRR
jgi:hypothetical protein